MDEKTNNIVPVVAKPLKFDSENKLALQAMVVTVGSLTMENFQPPVGQQMMLNITKVEPSQSEEATHESQVFGTHIKEAIAIVKDWAKRQ